MHEFYHYYLITIVRCLRLVVGSPGDFLERLIVISLDHDLNCFSNDTLNKNVSTGCWSQPVICPVLALSGSRTQLPPHDDTRTLHDIRTDVTVNSTGAGMHIVGFCSYHAIITMLIVKINVFRLKTSVSIPRLISYKGRLGVSVSVQEYAKTRKLQRESSILTRSLRAAL